MKFALAIKEIIGNKKFSYFFITNLAIGLIGFTSLDTFKRSFQRNLANSSKAILTGDIEISSRRKLTENELRKAEQILSPFFIEQNKHITLYSMIAGNGISRLVEIKAIEENHPFYGQIKLSDGINYDEHSNKDIHEKLNRVWVYPELLKQLHLNLGDQVKIGEKTVTITKTILDDTGMNWAGGAVAPRVYLSLTTLNQLGLIKFGSTAWYSYLYKLKESANSDQLVKLIKATYSDSSIRIKSHTNSNTQTGRLLNYLNDYLGLVALAALFLSCLGAIFLFRSYTDKRIKEIATLITLGMTPTEALMVSLIQLFVLGTLAAATTFILSFFFIPVIPSLAADFIPISINLSVDIHNLILVFIIAVYGSIAISIPMLARIKNIKVNILFQEQAMPNSKFKIFDIIYYIPAFLGATILAIWQANSIRIGLIFVSSFAIAAIIIAYIWIITIKGFEKFLSPKSLSLQLAIKQLTRNKLNSVTCFLALGLGSLLISLIPQLKEGLQSELTTPETNVLPSLFLFDIQEEQVSELKNLLKDSNTSFSQISPMIRARLLKINGKDFNKQDLEDFGSTREAERMRNQRNRSFNLSYRENLSKSETIIDGKAFTGPYDPTSEQEPKISLEYRFADRMGIEIGDKLLFDIQGVEISGTVINLRRVKWTSFQPNFFIQFQPGVLTGAPKTFVAAISSLKNEKALELQNNIVARLPNISIIDVSRLVTKLLDMVEKMSIILSCMAWLCLLTGMVVLYSVAEYQVRMRKSETALLKVLGAEFSDIQKSVIWEFAILGFASSVIGSAIAIAFSWGFSFLLFENLWLFNWKIPILTSLSVGALTILTSFIATFATLRKKPLFILRTQG
ncbi:MAG: FtsX-like permease family protein [Bdellovibrionota bacterium]